MTFENAFSLLKVSLNFCQFERTMSPSSPKVV